MQLRWMTVFVFLFMLGAAPAAGRPARRDWSPPVGAMAPDFTLPLLHGEPDETVRLADLRGKPVALVFGSYT